MNFHCESTQHPENPWNHSCNLLHFVVLVIFPSDEIFVIGDFFFDEAAENQSPEIG